MFCRTSSVPTSGHAAISALATNEAGHWLSMMKMSIHEMWLDTMKLPPARPVRGPAPGCWRYATSMPQAGNPAVAALGKEARRVFEFSMTALVKAPVVVDPTKPGAKPPVKPVAQVGGAPAPLAANSAGNSAGK